MQESHIFKGVLSRGLPAAVLSGLLLTTGCATAQDLSLQPRPTHSATPEAQTQETTQQTKTITATPSPATSEQSAGYSSYRQADGTIRGASAIFDESYTPAEVDAMESCGNNSDRVLLTFDDYGTPEHIQKIADILKSYGVGGAFFLNTSRVSQEVFDSLREQGFYAGNHTANHPNMVKLNETAKIKAIQSGGVATLFRPPYGGTYAREGEAHFDKSVADAVKKTGKRVCLWTIDTEDWRRPSAEIISNRVVNSPILGPKAVVLMHTRDEYNTAEALPAIITGVRQKGHDFCRLSDEPTTATIPENLPC